MSADVAGYSRLMGQDENATITALNECRAIFRDKIETHRGRVVDTAGDSVLAVFDSVVEAVQCATEVQTELGARNEDLPEDRRMLFRIGVNLGDVVEQDDGTIYGDGVNVAARLESLAEPGGVCLSGSAHEQVEGKTDLGFDNIGEHEVKNIARPVSVYRVRTEPASTPNRQASAPRRRAQRVLVAVAAGLVILALGGGVAWQLAQRTGPESAPGVASGDEPALEPPAKPSIAVLPFKNLSTDAAQEYFVDAFTEEIITALSQFRNLFVIASNSVFTYKGQAVKVDQVARELGVQYVLEGSVQKEGERLRVAAQLVDANTGHHVWAESFDRGTGDFFAVRDELTQTIVSGLAVREGALERAERERARRKPTESLKAYDYYLLGNEYAERYTKEDNLLARQSYQKATGLDPRFARAYSGLAYAHYFDWKFEWRESPSLSADLAFESARKAVALDPLDATNHWWLGVLYSSVTMQHEEALAEYEKAIALNPNHADTYLDWGWSLARAGRAEEGIEMMLKGVRLNPNYLDWYDWLMGMVYYTAHRYEEAIVALRKVKDLNLETRRYLAASYARQGLETEAQAVAAEILHAEPEFSSAFWARKRGYKNQVDEDHYFDGLRAAGLPE
ncbi:MAG: adenylate/guanylate cyclase domain-containing protein [Alphaproteobacteria bacterium]|nr:adenylate/guanylate cyclase domain-containing protein [Alphaproteobacteria bacterium]